MQKPKAVRILLFTLMGLFFAATLATGIKWGADYINRRINGVKSNVYLENINMTGYLPAEVSQIVELLALEVDRKAQNAGLDKVTGEIIPGKSGLVVDQEKTIGLILASPENTRHSLIIYPVEPEISTEELAQLTKVLGSFTTYFFGSPGRYQNIKTAMLAINNTLLLPGQLFSFNLATGPKTFSRGYQLAPVIMGEGHALGVGGGVCQVSTTLYNAAKRSNLQIVERHPHSKPVRYVPPGMDAAVAEGSKDLKIKNNFPHPVIIKASFHGGKIQVWILGKEEE